MIKVRALLIKYLKYVLIIKNQGMKYFRQNIHPHENYAVSTYPVFLDVKRNGRSRQLMS